MGRKAKPFPHQGWYKTNLGGTRHKLCPIEDGFEKAQSQLEALQRQLGTGIGPGLRPTVTVAQAHDEFLDYIQVTRSQGTYTFYVGQLKLFFSRYGARKLVALTAMDAISFQRYVCQEHVCKRGVRREKKGLAANSWNNILQACKALLNWSVERSYIQTNPWRKCRPSPTHNRSRLMTDAELQILLSLEPSAFWRDALLLLRNTTLRPGELRQLSWDQVSFERHCIFLQAAKHKSRKQRVITLIPVAEEILLRRLEGQKQRGLVFPSPRAGGLISPKTLSVHFHRLVEKGVLAGLLEKSKDGESLVPYTTRHTRITEMHVQKVHPILIQKDAGHSSYSMTQRYEHLAGSEIVDAIRAAAGGGGFSAPSVVSDSSSPAE